MPGKMPRSDPRPSVRVIRGAGSGQHLASVLQEGRKTRTLMSVWDSSGESRLKKCGHLSRRFLVLIWCLPMQAPSIPRSGLGEDSGK